MDAGYPLHIDATSDKGRGGLFLCLDGWRGWVLHAVKVSSENAAELQSAIERTVAAFGPPLATVRDLGSAGAKAVVGCRLEAVPHLVCHYHFLAAVGKQLLDVQYAVLRSQLRRDKVCSGLRELLRELRGRARVRADLAALILWVLEGSGHKHPPIPSPCRIGISTGVAGSCGTRRGAGCGKPRHCWLRSDAASASPGPCRGRSATGPYSTSCGIS